MILEINKLIDSDFNILKKVGWLLYNRENQDGGLSKDELNELLHIITVDEIQKEYQAGYDEGFDNAVCE